MLGDHRPSLVVHLAARVGGIGLQPGRAGAAVPRQPADGHLRDRGRPHGGGRQDRAGRHGVLLPQVHAGAVPRGQPVGRLPGGDQRPLRHRQEGPPRPRPGQRHQYGQRFAYLIPTNLYGPGDKFHPTRLARDPGAGEEVRRGQGARRRQGRGVGHRPGQPRVPLRRRRGRAPSCSPPRPTRAASRSTSATTTRSRSARRSRRSPAWSASSGELRWDPTKPDGQPRRRVDAGRAADESSAGGRAPRSRTGLRRTIDWYLANRDEAERPPFA